MKKRFSEAQIIGFLGEAEAGLPVKQFCRRHGFSEALLHEYPLRVGRRGPHFSGPSRGVTLQG